MHLTMKAVTPTMEKDNELIYYSIQKGNRYIRVYNQFDIELCNLLLLL